MPNLGRRRTLALLFILYFVQGLPFGFQKDLSAFLRQAGMSLGKVGFTGLLSLPWLLKALWAPLVDRYGSDRIGRRKSWILPLQLTLFTVCLITALFPPTRSIPVLLAMVFLMNLIAATQDIAVDGLAVDLIKDKDLGPANAIQVIGYKGGMLISSGILLSLYDYLHWEGILLVMAGLVLTVSLLLLPVREPPATERTVRTRQSLSGVLRAMWGTLKQPHAVWLVLFTGTYKIGETMVDAMFKPFLIDAGYPLSKIGQWVSTYGMVASLLGSALGGYLTYRLPILTVLSLTAVLRAFSVGGEWYLTLLGSPGPSAVIGVTVVEHFFGGALTAAMFAFMMSRVDKEVGATHYTLLACIEVVGKAPLAILSGVLAEQLGYGRLFLLGTVLSFAFLLLLLPLRQRPVVPPSTA